MNSSIGDRSFADLSAHITQIRTSLPPHVKLIAVSKQFPAVAIRAAYNAGIRDFGENRLQEAIAKQAELSDLQDITWHFIGHLQANKAKKPSPISNGFTPLIISNLPSDLIPSPQN